MTAMTAKLIVAVWLWTFRIVSAGTNEEGLKFLAENKNKPGVITLESGLQYKVRREAVAQATCYWSGARLTPALGFDRGNGQLSSIDQLAVSLPLRGQVDRWYSV
jgi:hypothetical protein